MANARDALRAARNKILNKAAVMGIDLEAERQKPGSNQRSLSHAAKRLINDAVPRTTAENLQTDAPPSGAFDSVNKTYTLSRAVVGFNIVVVFGHVSAGTTTPLTRTEANPPGTGTFFFDRNAPTQIVLGDAPDAADALIAVYKPV